MKIAKSQLYRIILEELKEFLGAGLAGYSGSGGGYRAPAGSSRTSDQYIRNPMTGKQIKIRSAMAYPRNHPVHQAATRVMSSHGRMAQEDGVDDSEFYEKIPHKRRVKKLKRDRR